MWGGKDVEVGCVERGNGGVRSSNGGTETSAILCLLYIVIYHQYFSMHTAIKIAADELKQSIVIANRPRNQEKLANKALETKKSLAQFQQIAKEERLLVANDLYRNLNFKVT